MLGIAYVAEVTGQLTLVAGASQVWALPFLIYLNVVDTSKVSRWVIWTVTTLLLSYPNGKGPRLAPPTVSAETDGSISASDPSRVELSKLQHGPVSHRLGRLLQHVRPSMCCHRSQHLSGR